MNQKLKDAAIAFFNALKENSDHNTVAISFFATHQGYEITFDNREHMNLLEEHVSMRNIKGEWV